MDGSKGYEHHSSVAAILPPWYPPTAPPHAREENASPDNSPTPLALYLPCVPSFHPSSILCIPRRFLFALTLALVCSLATLLPPFHPCVLVLLVSSPFLPSSSNGASSSYLNPRRAVPGLLNENLHLFVPPPLPLPPLLPPPPPPPLTLGHPLASPRQACPFSTVLSFQPATWGSADSRQRTATPIRGRLATYARHFRFLILITLRR